MNRKTAGRDYCAFVFRRALCFCCALAMLLAAALPAFGEELTWEERLEKARKKYNEKTVNVYLYRYGSYQKGKINVCFYYSHANNKKELSFYIRDSLQVTDEAEIQAVLEVVARNELFGKEDFGTISFLKAAWITHNLAYEMANGSADQQSLVTMVAGEKLSKVIGRAKELDIGPIRNTPEQEMAVYEFIESVYCHRETGQDDP